MNAPNPAPPSGGAHSDSWNDLRFTPGQLAGLFLTVSGNQNDTAVSTITRNEQEIVVDSEDYAAWGTLQCVAEIRVSLDSFFCNAIAPSTGLRSITIPKDENSNGISDAWQYESGAPVTEDNDELEGHLDNTHKGDGFTRFDEYRGFKVTDGSDPVIRTDPGYRDAIVYNPNETPVDCSLFASASGLRLHTIDNSEANAAHTANPNSTATAQRYVTVKKYYPAIHGENGEYDPIGNEARVMPDAIAGGVIPVSQVGWAALVAIEIKETAGHEMGHAAHANHHAVSPDEAARGPEHCLMRGMIDYSVVRDIFCTSTIDCDPGRGNDIMKIKVKGW